MPSNNLYMVAGVDRTSPLSSCTEGLISFFIYDLDLPEGSQQTVQANDIPMFNLGTDQLGSLIETQVTHFRKKYGRTLYSIRILYGENFSSSYDIVETLKLSSNLTLCSDGKNQTTFTLKNGTSRDTKIFIQKKLPMTFTFLRSDGTCSMTGFKGLINTFCQEYSLEDFCKKNWSVMKSVTSSMKHAFAEDEITPSSAAGDQALLELDYGMNCGGRNLSEKSGEGVVKKFMSFDINSSYNASMLEEEFSTQHLYHMNRIEEFRMAVGRFSKENREKTINRLYDSYKNHHRQYRVVLRTDVGLVVKPGHPSMCIPFNRRNAAPDVEIKTDGNSNRIKSIKGSFTFCMFISELKVLYENYLLADDFVMVDVLYTKTRKLPKKVRQLVLDSCVRAEIKKKHIDNLRTIGAAPSEVAQAHREADFAKLERNHLYGYFGAFGDIKDLATNKNWVYDPASVMGAAGKMQSYGMCLSPLVGSEIALHSRQSHRNLEQYFADRGFKAFYGNTDSIFVEYETEEDRQKLFHIMNCYNHEMNKKFKKAVSDLRYSGTFKKNRVPGTIKKENEGFCKYFGLNKMFIADSDYRIVASKFSGVRAADLMSSIPTSDIRLLTRDMLPAEESNI